MITLNIYYSIQNGGDGSAYPSFMESAELVEFDQNHMDEAWGEECLGVIVFESNSKISFKGHLQTKESYFIEKYIEYPDGNKNQETKEFVSQFFPNGVPIFSVKTEKTKNDDYLYNNIYVGDKFICKIFRQKEKSGEIFANIINNFKI